MIHGIHHITAICGDPQKNLEFYTGILGMRLVKKTVNFDDPETYHLYYGNETGHPGSLITFFPWMHMPEGKPGLSEATSMAFAVPENALEYWRQRFGRFGIPCSGPEERMNEKVLVFRDYDGIHLELVATNGLTGPDPGMDSPVPPAYAIRSVHSVALTIEEVGPTIELLTQTLGFRPAGEDKKRKRFACGPGGHSTLVDLIYEPLAKPGRTGKGSIHHVAFRTKNKESQLLMREKLNAVRLQVSPVIDRDYFYSVYFREPGGVLLEIATDPPGFTTDETLDELGTSLKLPAEHKAQEEHIRKSLPELKPVDAETYKG
ncbi:MAG: ring-cleaving dioxygenase [Balneolales bacterium]